MGATCTFSCEIACHVRYIAHISECNFTTLLGLEIYKGIYAVEEAKGP